MDWKEGRQLEDGQRARPVMWRLRYEGIALSPMVVSQQLSVAFRPGRSKSLKTWGRKSENPNGAHWIGVRNGTPLHIDPRYPRYTHQLIVHNGGWFVGGVTKAVDEEPFEVGTLFCLDTHSPHILLRDMRIGDGLYYLAISLDANSPQAAGDVIEQFGKFVGDL